MKEVYRIKKGKLRSNQNEVPFDFGLIFEDEGFFFFDLYVSESYDLKNLMERLIDKLPLGLMTSCVTNAICPYPSTVLLIRALIGK
jgi:hypothetical protein